MRFQALPSQPWRGADGSPRAGEGNGLQGWPGWASLWGQNQAVQAHRFMQDNVQCSLSCTKSPAHPQSLSAPKPSRCFSQSCPLHASGSFSTLLQSSKSLFMGHTAKVIQALQRTFQTRHSFVMEQEHLPGCPHHESSRLGWGPQLPPAFPSAQSSGFGTRYHQDPFPLLIPTPSLLA